jgi:hypothetical protein
MSTTDREDDVYEDASGWDKFKYAIKAAWSVMINRPIIVYFDDGTMYCRSNPFYLQAAAKNLNEIAEEQINRQITDQINNLLEIPKVRRN